jgi:hypothetical protein
MKDVVFLILFLLLFTIVIQSVMIDGLGFRRLSGSVSSDKKESCV